MHEHEGKGARRSADALEGLCIAAAQQHGLHRGVGHRVVIRDGLHLEVVAQDEDDVGSRRSACDRGNDGDNETSREGERPGAAQFAVQGLDHSSWFVILSVAKNLVFSAFFAFYAQIIVFVSYR